MSDEKDINSNQDNDIMNMVLPDEPPVPQGRMIKESDENCGMTKLGNRND